MDGMQNLIPNQFPMLSMYISVKHYLFVGAMFPTNITGLYYDRPRAACDMLGPLEMFAT